MLIMLANAALQGKIFLQANLRYRFLEIFNPLKIMKQSPIGCPSVNVIPTWDI